jgi:RimJ/RimL family protein N-acetyltransferase
MINGQLLRGQTVWLTSLDRNAVPVIARWEQDIEFLRLLDSSPARPRTEDEIARWLESEQRSPNNVLFGIRLLDTDDLIGWVELDGIQWNHGVCSLGIAIGSRSMWGQGYGAEALSLMLQFAFSELNLHGVHITVFSYNERAIKLYENLGFQREGVYREYLHRDGKRHDMLLYGILRREWENRTARSAGWRTRG